MTIPQVFLKKLWNIPKISSKMFIVIFFLSSSVLFLAVQPVSEQLKSWPWSSQIRLWGPLPPWHSCLIVFLYTTWGCFSERELFLTSDLFGSPATAPPVYPNYSTIRHMKAAWCYLNIGSSFHSKLGAAKVFFRTFLERVGDRKSHAH